MLGIFLFINSDDSDDSEVPFAWDIFGSLVVSKLSCFVSCLFMLDNLRNSYTIIIPILGYAIRNVQKDKKTRLSFLFSA